MKSKLLKWIPRILGIAYVLFLSMFALDVFSEYSKITDILIALFMHLIPSFVFLAILILAWKRPFGGGVIFIILTLLFTLQFDFYENLTSFLALGLPLLVIGILFILDAKLKKTAP